MIAYKVCLIRRTRRGTVRAWGQIWDETFRSVCAPNPLVYAVGRTTTRPDQGGPLALWRSFPRARSSLAPFIRKRFVCFECEYTPSSDGYLWDATLKCVELPQGTVLADCVTPLRAVPWEIAPCFMPTI